MIKSFYDLKVYQRSYRLAIDIHRIALQLPETERYELKSQLRRAAVSIPLNIAEGYGRKNSQAEFKHFLRNSLGSCNEVRVLLDLIKDLSYISDELHEQLTEDYNILGKQLNTLIQRWTNISNI